MGNNHLPYPQARHNEPLLIEKLLELSHVRKGSGTSNRQSFLRQERVVLQIGPQQSCKYPKVLAHL